MVNIRRTPRPPTSMTRAGHLICLASALPALGVPVTEFLVKKVVLMPFRVSEDGGSCQHLQVAVFNDCDESPRNRLSAGFAIALRLDR